MGVRNPHEFGAHLFQSKSHAYQEGQATANANGAPVAILSRDGWLTVCEEPPEDMDSDPFGHGWTVDALIEPEGWE